MSDRKKQAIWVTISVVVYIGTWGLIQYLPTVYGESWVFELLFCVVAQVGTGLIVALVLSRKFDVRMAGGGTKRGWIIGSLLLAVVLILATFQSGALGQVIENPPGVEDVAKYLCLFVPMCLAIYFQFFFLVPMTVEKVLGTNILGRSVAVVISAFCVGVGFFADGVGDLELALTMLMLGFFFGAGAVLTRSFWATFSVFIVVMLINTLAEAKYFDHLWPVLIAEAVIATVAVALWIRWHVGRRFTS